VLIFTDICYTDLGVLCLSFSTQIRVLFSSEYFHYKIFIHEKCLENENDKFQKSLSRPSIIGARAHYWAAARRLRSIVLHSDRLSPDHLLFRKRLQCSRLSSRGPEMVPWDRTLGVVQNRHVSGFWHSPGNRAQDKERAQYMPLVYVICSRLQDACHHRQWTNFADTCLSPYCQSQRTYCWNFFILSLLYNKYKFK
jgi:hypothetical protein